MLNYTTKIDANQTVGEIQRLLAQKNVKEIMVKYDNGFPSALMFSVCFGNEMLSYKLPCKWEKVHKILQIEAKTSAQKTRTHALNVAWRVIKDWVESQIALIETEMVDMSEVFLPYQMIDSVTVYERFTSTKLLSKRDEKKGDFDEQN